MDYFQKEFIGLIHAAFTGSPRDLSSNFDWRKAIDTAKKHNIASILFYGALNCNVSQDSEHMRELYHLNLQSLMISIRQMHEIEQIEDAFKKESIDYMPLKGAILKTVYPKPEMRTMGDADILIKLDQYPKIEKIVSQLGFEFQYESDHELVWKKPSLFLELHKRIMTTYNKDFYSYFGSGWKIANKVSNSSRYEMSAEDFYLYIFVHFTKHYRISGIGIKHLLDLWVYAKAQPGLNWKYIEDELDKLNLYTFYLNIAKTINVWFNEEDATEVTDLITNVIFNSEQYGSTGMATVNRALQNGKKSAWRIKFDKIFKAVFLPYQVMKKKYGILQKMPFLLPIMWGVRCFDVLFHHNKHLKQYVRSMNQIDAKQISDNQRALHFVGLDFPSKE